jgi:hypothetical protein
MELTLGRRAKATIGAFILTGATILFEYFNGGVVSHHLLAREDLPGFSNWWGLLTIPVLTWVVFSLIHRRDQLESQTKQNIKMKGNGAIIRFLFALLFGIIISILWELGLENVLQYFILTPFLIAFFKPLYLPEYLLGFVIGMIYTFGGILPIIIGIALLIICFVINRLVNLFKVFLA